MLALRGGTCCRRRRGNLGGRGTVGGTGKWGVRRGRGRGVALNTDECLNRKGFQTEGPPALGENVTPLKHKTHG